MQGPLSRSKDPAVHPPITSTMAEKSILLQHGDREVPVKLGATIHREALYGRQSKTVEKDGEPLQKVVLDAEGHVFHPSDVAYLPTDSRGSLAAPPLAQTEEGEPLEPKPSSFKVKRALQPVGVGALVRLRVDAVFPAECGLPPGLYSTEFAYRDAPVLKTAVLNVTPHGAFLLTGVPVETPLQGKTDIYSFFDEPEDEVDDDGDDEDISFEMF